MDRHTDRRSLNGVFITGGASGIGLSIAREFALQGFRVAVCDSSSKALAELDRTELDIFGYKADIASHEDTRSAIEAAQSAIGGIGILINNAGIAGPTAAIDEVKPADWQKTIDVNLSGPYNTMQLVSSGMKTRKAGCIINIVTASVRTGLPLRVPYIASKAGLLGMTKTLARELGPYGIRCNAILPGLVDGPRSDFVLNEKAKKDGITLSDAKREAARFVSMRTFIAPEEVASAALFLASDSARHVTGQSLGVCGSLEWEG